MGFERIQGEITFPDADQLDGWLDAEIDVYEIFGGDSFWTHQIEAAMRDGQIHEDPPQNVQEIIEALEFDSGDIDMTVEDNHLLLDGHLSDATDDGYFVEAFKLAAVLARAADFGAEGTVTFADGWHQAESQLGDTFTVELALEDGGFSTTD